MHQVYNNLSTYSADLFGVCSALYELGGLIVMHDASGCNSTYNTHDEPRWYTMDSMVYVSGLNEQDAILGNDERLIRDICDVANRERPKFIALSRSVLPTYMGTDVRGIARVIEKRTGIPAFGFTTNGMDSYILGAGAAYRAIAERFCVKSAGGSEPAGKPKRLRVNLMGVTPLDFSVSGNVEALSQTIRDMGFEIQSNWSMGGTLEELKSAPDADVTLVVSATGMPAAAYLEKAFGVPAVIGQPVGKSAIGLLRDALIKAAETKQSRNLYDSGDAASQEEAGFASALLNTESSLRESEGRIAAGDRIETSLRKSEDRIATEEQRSENQTGTGENAGTETISYRICIVGEAVHAAALRACLENDCGCDQVFVLCPLEKDAGVLRATDYRVTDEASITSILNQMDCVIADPIYRRVTDPSVCFVDDPHDACSGRMYHDRGWRYIDAQAGAYLSRQLQGNRE